MHRVIGVRRSDRREDIFRSFDLRIFLLERRQHALADRPLLAEEAVGLDEIGFARASVRPVPESARRKCPNARSPEPSSPCARAISSLARRAAALATRIMQSAPASFEPRQLRHHVDVVVLVFLDAGDLDRWIGLAGGQQALSRSTCPQGLLMSIRPAFFDAELLMREFEQLDIDQRVDRRHAEGVVGIGAVARDARCRPPTRPCKCASPC